MASLNTNNPNQLSQQVCITCGETLKQNPARTRKYCSGKCRSEAYFGKPPPFSLHTGDKGALSEMLACADLLKRGFHVFRAISPSAPCDLIAMKGTRLIRVEVTTVRRATTGVHYNHKRHKSEKYDVLAFVILGEDIVEYEPSIT